METSVFLTRLWATDNPVLPTHAAMQLAQAVGWSLVLGCATLLLAARVARPYRLALCFLVMLWAWVPGSASPAYWLGLSFQAPSLTSDLLCLVLLATLARDTSARPQVALNWGNRGLKRLAALGIGLGWVLLLDTLAYLPQSVYGWGFSPAALGAVAFLMAVLWGFGGHAQGRPLRHNAGVLLGLVLVVFVATRLPSGNLWDALIDPWLWVVLQVMWLRGVWRQRQARQRLLPATPA